MGYKLKIISYYGMIFIYTSNYNDKKIKERNFFVKLFYYICNKTGFHYFHSRNLGNFFLY